MLQDHHALAASETPMTSEISSNSGTVANQNSTTIRNSQAKVTNNTTSNSTQQSSEIKNSTTKTSSSEVINKNESSSEKAVESIKKKLVKVRIKHKIANNLNHLQKNLL